MVARFMFINMLLVFCCSITYGQDSISTFFPWVQNGELCQINAAGEVKIDKTLTNITYPSFQTVDEYSAYEEQYLYGFKDKSGAIIIKAGYEQVGNFREGFAWVKLDHKRYYFINKDEKPLINFTFDRCFDFQNGLARVYDKSTVVGHDGFGYLDSKGEIVIPLQYKKAFDFVNGYALVQEKNGQWWLIDTSGEKVQGACIGLKARKDIFMVEI